MNKKLIALAVAGATFAPAVMAQSANPVTLYGRVYAMFETVKASGGTAIPVGSRTRVSDQSSLLGVRGTEDLGGGLKAFFQLETAFRPDSNDTTFAARNSAVGLQGDFGSVLLGRWDTPFKTTTIAIDPFGDLTIGGITGAMSDRANFDRREQNVFQYWTPTIGGFAGRFSYSANEAKTALATGNTNPGVVSTSLTYTQGPIYVGYAWERHKDIYRNYTGAAANVAGGKEKGQALFGSYTFGPIKIGLLTQKFEKLSGGANRVSDQKSNMGNVTYTTGKNQFVYQHARSKDGAEITPAGVVTTGVQPDCKINTLAYFYNFSRRTSFLGQYTKVNNNAAGRCNFGANTLTLNGPDQDPTGFAVGLRHTF
ncbi:MAG: porin [Betaproteobacteria bacterium]|nr:porin [Betaproteobacteria bacterium]